MKTNCFPAAEEKSSGNGKVPVLSQKEVKYECLGREPGRQNGINNHWVRSGLRKRPNSKVG
jgi:hypothetical protein